MDRDDHDKPQQRRIKISQPIALDRGLRDILERHSVIKPPVVPKVELLEKYILAHGWTYAINQHNGSNPGTTCTLHVPGGAAVIDYTATATTLALALTMALCEALEGQPRTLTYLKDDPNDLGPLFGTREKTAEQTHPNGGWKEKLPLIREQVNVLRGDDVEQPELDGDDGGEISRRLAVAAALATLDDPTYRHIEVDPDGHYFDEEADKDFDPNTVEIAYADAIRLGLLPWTDDVLPSAQAYAMDHAPATDKTGSGRAESDDMAQSPIDDGADAESPQSIHDADVDDAPFYSTVDAHVDWDAVEEDAQSALEAAENGDESFTLASDNAAVDAEMYMPGCQLIETFAVTPCGNHPAATAVGTSIPLCEKHMAYVKAFGSGIVPGGNVIAWDGEQFRTYDPTSQVDEPFTNTSAGAGEDAKFAQLQTAISDAGLKFRSNGTVITPKLKRGDDEESHAVKLTMIDEYTALRTALEKRAAKTGGATIG